MGGGVRSTTVSAFDGALRWVNRWLIVAMMAAMTGLVFANVVTRYLFKYSIIWAEEVSQFLMVWIAYLGAGLALREGRHVSVDIFQDWLPSGLRRGLRLLVALALLAFMATLAVLGYFYLLAVRDQETPVLQLPLSPCRNDSSTASTRSRSWRCPSSSLPPT